jgi:hypothetical protein
MFHIPDAKDLSQTTYVRTNPINNNPNYSQTSPDHSPTTQIKGLFNSIPQETFKTKASKTFNPATKIITEQYDAHEVLPGMVYNYDLGIDEFIRILKTVDKPAFKVYDNYYYYQNVLSIHKRKKSGFIEKTISQEWLETENKYQKISEVSNLDLLNHEINLMNQYDFHLMAKIIRFKINPKETLEIIIPDHKYRLQPNIFTNQLLTDHKALKLPEETTFIRKKCVHIQNKIEPMSGKDKQHSKSASAGPGLPYIPKSRRRRMFAKTTSTNNSTPS